MNGAAGEIALSLAWLDCFAADVMDLTETVLSFRVIGGIIHFL